MTYSHKWAALKLIKEKGPLSSAEILEIMRERWPKRVPSTQRLAQILSRHSEFEKIGKKPSHRLRGGEVYIWNIRGNKYANGKTNGSGVSHHRR